MPMPPPLSSKIIWRATMDKKPNPISAPQPIEDQKPKMTVVPKSNKMSRRKKVILFSGLGLLTLIIGLVAGGWFWYQYQLSPVGNNPQEYIKVTIDEGTQPDQIGEILEEKKLIRNQAAFSLYARLSGKQNLLQAGTYRLSPADSTPEIVDHLKNGNTDSFSIMFLPGATLEEHREVLISAGYSEEEVDTALAKTYESPLFKDKPAGTSLEGYIYGDTYNFGSGASVGDILTYVFEIFNGVIEEEDLEAQFATNGLNLYEGITLASIIQREAVGGDEPQIAQVFYSRLAIGMVLGSDVTYQYIADKTGVPRDPSLDSPYNTRRYGGLPPGPIASPGLAALKAVGQPADGDYLFFLSGDDNITYFGRTNAEHEANIVNHCQKKCLIL